MGGLAYCCSSALPVGSSQHWECSPLPRSPMTARVLVLDDEPAIRALVARALGEEGYDVVTVANGLVGLEAAKENHFDLDDVSRPSDDELHDGVQTLYKPFSISALQSAVRKLLEA